MNNREETYTLNSMLQAARIQPLDGTDRIYSQEMREIVSARPAWIIRNGIALFFVIIGLLVTLCFFIQYPDMVKAPVRIVGKNLPKQIVTKVEGKLVRLFVKENDTVKQGDLLAVIQSNADYKQVLTFKEWIKLTEENINKQNWGGLTDLVGLTNLGDVQKSYQDLQQQLYQLSWSKPNGYFDQKKRSIQKDIGIISELETNANQQKRLIELDLEMQQHLLSINEGLVKDKVVALLDLNKDKSAVIAKQQQLIQIDGQNINQEANALSKQKELIEINKSSLDIQQNFTTTLLNAKSVIAEWLNRYVIVASESGKLQFNNYFQENSWIKAGQELFYIIPAQPSYFAEVLASQQNFGKLAIGQQVNIALNSYQRNEFGILKGIIQNIPLVPYRDSSFIIKVKLQNGLLTNYKKTIHFTNNLTGAAEIITNDATLAERLLYQWRGLFKR